MNQFINVIGEIMGAYVAGIMLVPFLSVVIFLLLECIINIWMLIDDKKPTSKLFYALLNYGLTFIILIVSVILMKCFNKVDMINIDMIVRSYASVVSVIIISVSALKFIWYALRNIIDDATDLKIFSINGIKNFLIVYVLFKAMSMFFEDMALGMYELFLQVMERDNLENKLLVAVYASAIFCLIFSIVINGKLRIYFGSDIFSFVSFKRKLIKKEVL